MSLPRSLALVALCAFVANAFATSPIPNSFWPLHDMSTSSQIDTTGAQHGVVEGVIQTITDSETGRESLWFDGATSVRIPNSPSLNPQQITVAAWIKPQDATRNEQLFSKDQSSGGNERVWQFRKHSDGSVMFLVFNGSTHANAVGGSLVSGEWQHVAGTWDGNAIRVYVNGALVASQTFSGSLRQGQTNDVFIGRSENSNPRFFIGSMRDVQLYDEALSPSSISELVIEPEEVVPPPQHLIRRWLEAEEPTTLQPPMQIGRAEAASEGRFLAVPEGTGSGGEAHYQLADLPSADYWIWVRHRSPSGGSNSVYTYVNGGPKLTWHLPVSNDWVWSRHPTKQLFGDPGPQTIRIRNREDGTEIDKVLVVNRDSYTPSGTEDVAENSASISIEAESGDVTAPMVVDFDAAASAGEFLVCPGCQPGTGGQVTYDFDIKTPGNYYVWTRVRAPSSTENSLYVSIDGNSESIWHIPSNANWVWRKPPGLNQPVNLGAGSHTLKIRRREMNTGLDRIVVTRDAGLVPGDLPSAVRSALYSATWDGEGPVHSQIEDDLQDFSYAGAFFDFPEVDSPPWWENYCTVERQVYDPERMVYDTVIAAVPCPRGDCEFHGVERLQPDGTLVIDHPEHCPTDSREYLQGIIDRAEARALATGEHQIAHIPSGTYFVSKDPSINESSAAHGSDAALLIDTGNITLQGAPGVRIVSLDTHMRYDSIVLVRPPPSTNCDTMSHHFWENGAILVEPQSSDLSIGSLEVQTQAAVGQWIVVTADVTNDFLDRHNQTAPQWHINGTAVQGPAYLRQIVAKSGSTATLNAPVRLGLKVSDGLRVQSLCTPPVQNVRIKGILFGMTQNTQPGLPNTIPGGSSSTAAFQVFQSSVISLHHAANVLIDDVHTFYPGNDPACYGSNSETQSCFHILSNGITIWQSAFVTLRDTSFQRPLYRGGVGNGYMYRINANETLIQNAFASRGRHNMSFLHMQASGIVVLDSRVEDGAYPSDFHNYLTHSNLIDNLELSGEHFSAVERQGGHGQAATETVFWNIRGVKTGLAQNNTNYYSEQDELIYGDWQGVAFDRKSSACSNEREILINSGQANTGYVIGTSGPVAGVCEARSQTVVGDPSATCLPPQTSCPIYPDEGNDPHPDHLEHVGQGHRLEPRSLYLDQRRKRLGY